MARTIQALTATQIKQAKPKEKDYKLSDGGGLYLLVTKRGTKLWRMKYKFDGKEKLLSLGAYPEVALLKARELREKHKIDIANGINPNAIKKEKKLQIKEDELKSINTFENIALERLKKVKDEISESHYKRTANIFKNYVFKSMGDIPIDEVQASDIIKVLVSMMEKNIKNSTQKAFQVISKTFKYAVAHGYASRNPANDFDISEIVGKINEQHYPTITDNTGIKNLLISIKEYQGETSTKYALLMLAYTFVRPTNARLALWSEIDLNAKQWVIPAKKMKTKEEFTPHGFRAMFSTIAHEKSHFKYDVIETQLAHSVGNSVSQAYNRAKYLDERVDLMQWWSDYLDEVQR